MGHALEIALIGFSVLLAVLPSHAQRRVALFIDNRTSSNVARPAPSGPGSGPLEGNSTLQLSQNKPPVPPADLLIEDVPLPRNVSISNPQNLPENFKRFSGAWVGAWGGQLHHVLIVESIMADGTANIVYAIGDNPAANVRRQWQRGVAIIVGNTLRVARSASYEITGNGQLDATYHLGNGPIRATMSRIELADLMRPSATIPQWPPVAQRPLADLLVEDVPLPGNVSISNPQNVPENFKRFSGAWVGAWGGRLHHVLIVESIMADGTANIVYAVGDNPAAYVRRQWVRREATIVGNTLRVAQLATYELTGNGQLDATYETNKGRSLATMSRIELADLTRLGATTSQNRLTPPTSKAALPPWSLVGRTQQPEMPVVGFLDLRSPNPDAVELTAFREGLAAAGFAEGRNVFIEYRWASNQQWLLAPLAAELVRRQVDVIVALDSQRTIFAASNATSTIPIVFSGAEDPTTWSRVGTLNRPSGNMTGVTLLSSDLTGKRLDLLREIAPLATTIAYLTDPREFNSDAMTKDMLAAARILGRQALILEARNELELDAAFNTLVKSGAGGLVVSPHLLFMSYRDKIVELAARHKIPAIYPHRSFAVRGGLMSYAAEGTALWRLVGSLYVAQILRGSKPADLPVQQATKFEFVINMQAARALGIEVPPALLALTDEAIE
jgi:putative tryptophan/tyrosine transport system substrate-binding protein